MKAGEQVRSTMSVGVRMRSKLRLRDRVSTRSVALAHESCADDLLLRIQERRQIANQKGVPPGQPHNVNVQSGS
jgi:hypothetical protein